MALTKVAPAGIGSTPGDGYRIGSSFLHSTGAEITNVNATGIVTAANVSAGSSVTATTFYGSGANLTGISTATQITVADESTDTTCFPLFGTAATGNLAPKTGTNLTFNSANGTLAATTFSGSGANLTSIPAGQLTGTVATARLGSGTANNSSFLRGDQTWAAVTSTTINNNADNRIITGSGTANTLEAESTLLWSGNALSAYRDNATTYGPGIVVHHQRGTIGSPSVVQTNDTLLNIVAKGYDGNDYHDAARIDFVSGSGTPGNNDMPGSIVFKTTDDGQSSSTTRVTIQQNGNLLLDNSCTLLIPDAIQHVGDTNTQIRFPAADTITAETGGSERLRITSGGSVRIGGSTPVGYSAHSAVDDIVVGGTSSHGITVLTGNSATGNLWFDSENGNRGYIQYAHNEEALILGTENNERARITSAGNFLVGKNSVYGSGKAQVHNTSQYCLDVATWAADATGPTIDFYKSRNATPGSATVVQSGDVVGRLRFLGNDGANSRTAAQITAEVDGTPGTNDMPGRLVFSTVPDGSTTVTERLRIDSSGSVHIDGPTAAAHGLRFTPNGWNGYDNRMGYCGSSGADFWWSSNWNPTDGARDHSGYATNFIRQNVDTGYIAFGTGPANTTASQRLKIDNSAIYVQSGFPLAFLASSGATPNMKSGGTNNQDLLFTTGSGNPTRLQITSAGKILGGNHLNDRGAVFQIESSEHTMIGIHRNTNNHGAPAMYLSASRGTTAGSNTIVHNGDFLGLISFLGADGSDLAAGAQITGIVDGVPGSNDMPGRLGFWTSPDGTQSPKERLRIDSSGRALLTTAENFNFHSNHAALHINTPTDGGQGGLYVRCLGQSGGTASPHYGIKIDAINAANNANIQYGLQIDLNQQLISSGTGVYADVQGNYSSTKCFDAHLNKSLGAYTNGYSYFSNIVTSSSGGTAYHAYFQDNGTLKFRIYLNGNAQNANNSWGSTSDVKLKENIVDAGSQWADIKAVKVRNFNFKASTGQDTSKHIGVIAQEIETVSPGLVHTDNDTTMDEETGVGTVTGTTKSVKYSILYMKAIKALQEAMTRIETLEAKVTAIESS